MLHSRIHPTTTRIINSLKAAGFRRNEFSVTTPKDKNGEYRSPIITLYNTQKAIERIPSILEQNLGVYLIMLDNRIAHVSIEISQRFAIRSLDDNTLVELENGRLSYFDFSAALKRAFGE